VPIISGQKTSQNTQTTHLNAQFGGLVTLMTAEKMDIYYLVSVPNMPGMNLSPRYRWYLMGLKLVSRTSDYRVKYGCGRTNSV